MVYICICKYPLLLYDNREGLNTEYTALPSDLIAEGDIPAPLIFDTMLDGVAYKAVEWNNYDSNNHVNMYDVVNHKVFAGCSPSEIKLVDGEVKCDSKKIFVVLHPKDEWEVHHIVKLPPTKIK